MTEFAPEDVAGTVDDEPVEEHERAPDAEILRDELDDLASEMVGAGPVIETGHPAVDEVLRTLDVLSSEPVDAHVAVFEQAHEQLRRTLSGAGEDD